MTASEHLFEPDWLSARRAHAAARVGELDLPRFKGQAGWEFTDLSGLDLDSFPAAAATGSSNGDSVAVPDLFAEGMDDAVRLTQIGGVALAGAEALELPEGVIVAPLDVAAREHPELVEAHLGRLISGEDDAFVARNDAGWRGGALIYVPRGVHVAHPILVTAVQGGVSSGLQWRTLVVLEEGAQAEVWEQYLSTGEEVDGLFNTVVELSVGPNAHLRYVCGQALSERTWVFGAQRAEIERDGGLDWVALGFGSARGKVRMDTRLAGPGADAKVTGAYAGHARQHLDFDTTQEHAARNTTSDLAFRGVLQGRSTAVWRGMIRVDPGAQQTDAFQESRNLLLSKRAHADAIPGLEIEANDVRCTHAAAIAQIDPEQLFYLRSRGLRDEVARRLVIEGFLEALVERFEPGPVRASLSGALEQRLELVLGAG